GGLGCITAASSAAHSSPIARHSRSILTDDSMRAMTSRTDILRVNRCESVHESLRLPRRLAGLQLANPDRLSNADFQCETITKLVESNRTLTPRVPQCP